MPASTSAGDDDCVPADRFVAMTALTPAQQRLCDDSPWDFSGLRALFVNCTLKRSPERSHTQGLADRSIAIMDRLGVSIDVVRAVDHEIAPGVYPDMTEHGWQRDEWPAIFEQVRAADILVLLSPICRVHRVPSARRFCARSDT